jgi:hypothetical protein
MKGFPWTTWTTIISLILVIATMPLIPGQGAGLMAGLFLLVFYSAAFLIFRTEAFRRIPAPVKPFFENDQYNPDANHMTRRQWDKIKKLLGRMSQK